MQPKQVSRQVDALRHNTVFEGLTAQQIDEILPCILRSVKTYGPQECVCNRGDLLPGVGVVLQGRLLVCEKPQGNSPMGICPAIEVNQLFGEVDAFSSQSAMPNTVIAETDSTVLYLSRDFFLNLCPKECGNRKSHETVTKNLLCLLADRSIMLSKKIAYLTASDLKTKIAMYLLELYEVNCSGTFHMPLNRNRLAEFFDVARPSLSRELINLKTMGVIEFNRSQVHILDLDALRRITGGE